MSFNPDAAGAWWLFFAVGALACGLVHQSWALLCEFCLLPLIWAAGGWLGCRNPAISGLPLAMAVLIATGWPGRTAIKRLITLSLGGLGLAGSLALALSRGNGPGPAGWFLLAAALSMLLVDLASLPAGAGRWLGSIDVLIASYTGNTYHFADAFVKGAQATGSEVRIHRFHYYREFEARLDAEALVVAFPVFGWKPPWPLLHYLLFKLRRGGGKPAFVIYTSGGGPENAGVLVLLILAAKGYRVIGRASAVYPINVPTVRLGPARLWRALDELLPRKRTMVNQLLCGSDFAEGKPAGLPFILWPSPLVPAGLLLDNRLVDRLYRNHVMKKRCTACGLCVRFCPSRRLSMRGNRPHAKGECMLCLGCVNLCPNNAMHMFGFTEYGRRYVPRWTALKE